VPGDTAAKVVQTKEPEQKCPNSEIRTKWRHARVRTSELKGHLINARAAFDLKFLYGVGSFVGTSNRPHA
jgi:hypothetical protein